MRERIHRRLPVAFVKEVLESFNGHRISEKEAMGLLGIRRSRLHQPRRRWLLGHREKPFCLWETISSAFHVIAEQVKEWLDKELNYIRHEADTFRGKFNLPS
jgi:hypothetical protein